MSQKIHFCSQCGDTLPLRCVKCIRHPERKPRVVELFDAPPILRTGPCGCILIQCQRQGCKETRWCRLKADGTFELKNYYCSKYCGGQVTGEARKTRQILPCSYPGCTKKVEKHVSSIVRTKRIYCGQSHHYAHRTIMKLERKAAEKHRKAMLEKVVLLSCRGKCRNEVTTHTEMVGGMASCQICNNVRDCKIRIAGGGI